MYRGGGRRDDTCSHGFVHKVVAYKHMFGAGLETKQTIQRTKQIRHFKWRRRHQTCAQTVPRTCVGRDMTPLVAILMSRVTASQLTSTRLSRHSPPALISDGPS